MKWEQFNNLSKNLQQEYLFKFRQNPIIFNISSLTLQFTLYFSIIMTTLALMVFMTIHPTFVNDTELLRSMLQHLSTGIKYSLFIIIGLTGIGVIELGYRLAQLFLWHKSNKVNLWGIKFDKR